jgi:hypothetical protein
MELKLLVDARENFWPHRLKGKGPVLHIVTSLRLLPEEFHKYGFEACFQPPIYNVLFFIFFYSELPQRRTASEEQRPQ